MASRCARLVLLFTLLPAPGLVRAAGAAEKDAGRFPRLVRLLLLPEEQALWKQLRDDKDKAEFQRLFWARRDPSPGTAVNEFEDAARATWARADELFSYPNEKGAETGCGQVLVLLGRPEEIRGQSTGTRFDNQAFTREGSRQAETWVYRDRPGRAFKFTRAELPIALDSDCRFVEGGILDQDLRRAAEALVVRPEIGYRRGPDGHLLPYGPPAGNTAGAIDLLTTPRSDFPLAAETKLVMRGPKGEALVVGLVGLPAPPAGAAAPASVSLAVRAVAAGGPGTVSGARDSLLATAADGSGVASWGLALKPGRYQVTVAALLPEAKQGASTTLEVDVPDFGAGPLVASPLVIYPDEAGGPAAAPGDLRDPYAAFQVVPGRLRPRFGNAFAATDSILVVATVHGAKLDPATGQGSLRARYSVLKDGKPVARGGEDVFTTADAVASVGPIPLAGYKPGAYLVRLDVTDAVGQLTLRQEASFEIRQP